LYRYVNPQLVPVDPQKGCGYHLDLFIVSFLIIICSVFGLPWFVAATVLAINHVKSLSRETETSAPGDKPQFLGIRLTGQQRPCFVTQE
jgi:hypothetical protein